MDDLNPAQDGRITLDMLLGGAVFGIVGAAIGYYLNATASIYVSAIIGLVFGMLIGLLGGRRFFISIICGAIIGGGLAAVIAGQQSIALGAATGGAMGGFLGVQLGMILDLRREHKNAPRSSTSQ